MISEEIITGLKNAIERKESLEQAKQILIDSGYNEKEVQEASKFVGGGVLKTLEKPKPEEQLIMPEQKKSFFSKLKFWKKKSLPLPQEQPTAQQPTAPAQKTQPAEPIQPQQEIKTEKNSLAKQLEKIKPKKPSHLREVVLTIILLILLIVLAVIIFFKGTIFGWFA